MLTNKRFVIQHYNSASIFRVSEGLVLEGQVGQRGNHPLNTMCSSPRASIDSSRVPTIERLGISRENGVLDTPTLNLQPNKTR